MPSPDQLRILQAQIAPAAVASEAATGIPAEVTAAQAILESGWLASMPPDSRNPFGIKGTSANGVLAATSEWFTDAELAGFLRRGEGRTAIPDPKTPGKMGSWHKYLVKDYFRQYATLAEAFADHARLLSTGALYRPAMEQYRQDHRLETFIDGIAEHYATAPSYAMALKQIAMSKDVVEAVAALRFATKGY